MRHDEAPAISPKSKPVGANAFLEIEQVQGALNRLVQRHRDNVHSVQSTVYVRDRLRRSPADSVVLCAPDPAPAFL